MGLWAVSMVGASATRSARLRIASVFIDIVVSLGLGASTALGLCRLDSPQPPVSKPGRPTNPPATAGAPSTRFSGRAGSRRGAGPFSTRALSLRSNSEKWHGHLIVLDVGCQSQLSHPVCVHTAE